VAADCYCAPLIPEPEKRTAECAGVDSDKAQRTVGRWEVEETYEASALWVCLATKRGGEGAKDEFGTQEWCGRSPWRI
jgi:hypothetical protein